LAAGAYWRCPICLRRVPDKVTECYCGRRRQPGDGPDAIDTKKDGGTGVWVALALIALAGLASLVMRRAPAPARPLASPAASLAPGAAEAGRSPAAAAPGPAGPALIDTLRVVPAASPEAPPSAQPAPRPTPTPADSVDARREQGTLAFENAMRNLRGRAEVLARRLDNLARNCPPEATRVMGCDGLREEIVRDAQDIRAAADDAEEAARRGWVEPGAIRDARERHGLREGDLRALLARVDEALRR
jgi:hypothetical protein